MLGYRSAVENVIRQEQRFRVLAELVENAFSPRLRRLSYKQRVNLQAAANRLLYQTNSLDRTQAIVRRSLRKSFAELLHQRILPAGNRTQSLPALGGYRHSFESLYSAPLPVPDDDAAFMIYA